MGRLMKRIMRVLAVVAAVGAVTTAWAEEPGRNQAVLFQTLRSAADHGDASAQVRIGRMYEDGQGVRRDRREALRWYRMAADQGNPAALARLEELRAEERAADK
jgi:TPR repeat protein